MAVFALVSIGAAFVAPVIMSATAWTFPEESLFNGDRGWAIFLCEYFMLLFFSPTALVAFVACVVCRRFLQWRQKSGCRRKPHP